jgi:hypothetical protein
MSYTLADGSLSTDYKIGDEFHYEGRTFTLVKDDGTDIPWFHESIEEGRYPIDWASLTHVKPSSHSTLIKSIRETIQYLERTIQELES